MQEQKSDTSENQEITELGYPEPEDSELLVDPVSLRVTATINFAFRCRTPPSSSNVTKMYVKLVRK